MHNGSCKAGGRSVKIDRKPGIGEAKEEEMLKPEKDKDAAAELAEDAGGKIEAQAPARPEEETQPEEDMKEEPVEDMKGEPVEDMKEEPVEDAKEREEIELPEEERLKKELENVRRQLESQTALAQEYFNRLARMKADFENFRRRSQKEKEELAVYASEQLIKSLLPVLDNFERALVDESRDFDKFKDGIKMIYTQMCDILSAEGLSPIPAKGEEFDPEKHEAVMSEESSEHPENAVLEELRKGYTLKGKVIRPSMVKVAKFNQQTAGQTE